MFGFVFSASWFEEKRSSLVMQKGPEEKAVSATKGARATIMAPALSRAGETRNINQLTSKCRLHGGKA
jgi:hypothetical protein